MSPSNDLLILSITINTSCRIYALFCSWWGWGQTCEVTRVIKSHNLWHVRFYYCKTVNVHFSILKKSCSSDSLFTKIGEKMHNSQTVYFREKNQYNPLWNADKNISEISWASGNFNMKHFDLEVWFVLGELIFLYSPSLQKWVESSLTFMMTNSLVSRSNVLWINCRTVTLMRNYHRKSWLESLKKGHVII